MNDLIKNIDKVHTIKAGLERVSRVEELKDIDVNAYFREQILNADKIERDGENWLAYVGNTIFTINAEYTIITATPIKPPEGLFVIDFNDKSKNCGNATLGKYHAQRLAKRIYRDAMRDIAEQKKKEQP